MAKSGSSNLLVAMWGPAGLLLSALFLSGCDKSPAAGSPAESAASTKPVARDISATLIGTWISEPTASVYEPDKKVRLRLLFKRDGKDLAGNVSEIPEKGASNVYAFDMLNLRLQGDTVQFHVVSSTCCLGGKDVPYKEQYTLKVQSGAIDITRVNDLPNGGKPERFVVKRS
jgi:hypothetical protein